MKTKPIEVDIVQLRDNANASLLPSRRAPVQIKGKSFKDMTAEERKQSFHC